jgi:peptidoglycan/LPS O-acetylase OafA/YrhL
MENYNFKFSEPTSVHLYIIRFLSAQLITIAHGIQGIGFFKLGDYIGSWALMYFFLISGLLISYSTFRYMRNEKYNFKEYFIRRFSRIYPNLILVLVLIIFIDGFYFLFFGGKDAYNSYNIITFIFTSIFLNDSALGVTSFGSARQLWALPPIFWVYMVFGWIILGQRTIKKKYIYSILIGFFSFMLILIILGYNFWNKLRFTFIWFLGVFFSYGIYKCDKIFQQKTTKLLENREKKIDSMKKKIRIFCVINILILLILAIIRLYFHADPLDTLYYFLLVGVVLLFIIYSQYSSLKYPDKIKKIIIFLADYSLTLYLMHFSLYNLLMGYLKSQLNDILALLIMFLLVNIVSMVVAYFTEMRSDKIYNFLQEKFDLE